jgi:hypothetical protein
MKTRDRRKRALRKLGYYGTVPLRFQRTAEGTFVLFSDLRIAKRLGAGTVWESIAPDWKVTLSPPGVGGIRAELDPDENRRRASEGNGARGEVRKKAKADGASGCGSKGEEGGGRSPQRHRRIIQRQPQHHFEAVKAGCSRCRKQVPCSQPRRLPGGPTAGAMIAPVPLSTTTWVPCCLKSIARLP